MADQRKLPISTPEQDGLSGLLLENLLANSADAIVVTDVENKIVHWSASAEALFGYPAEKIIGKSILVLLPETTISEVRTTNSRNDDITGISAEGSPLTMSLKVSEVIDSENNLVALTYIFHDLRERLRQEESIQQQIRALEAFSYSVSHDLRAPLRRIINYAEILAEDHASSLNDEVQRLISRMSKNAQKMSELINDLLAFSRVGQHALQKIGVNMNGLIKSVVDEQRNTAEGARVTFEIERVESSEGDPTLLKQVFENLISNAIKYSTPKQNPFVKIGCIPGKDEITYYVKDNGVGFDMQYSPKLFNVFQRLHNPSDFEGTGIGLAIVQQIISRHGGTVHADAIVNEGATFSFTLPK
jgi:PAS domain S-box-containing protein